MYVHEKSHIYSALTSLSLLHIMMMILLSRNQMCRVSHKINQLLNQAIFSSLPIFSPSPVWRKAIPT